MPWNDTRPPVLGVDIGKVLVDGLLAAEATAPSMVRDADVCLHRLVGVFDGRVHLISKAGPQVERATHEWLVDTDLLQQVGLPADHVHFVREHRDKAPVARRLGITHMVDDQPGVHVHLTEVHHRYLFRTERSHVPAADDPMRGVTPVPDWPTTVDMIQRSLTGELPDDLPRDLEIRPMSVTEARQWAASWHPAAVLSVVNEPDDAIRSGLEQLVVCFRDIAIGDEVMLPAQVHEIIEWARLLSDGDRVLVHCRGGIGRSPAVTIGLMVATGRTPRQATDWIHVVRGQATPNPHVISLFDDALGQNGQLRAAVSTAFPDWKPGRPR